MLNGRPGVQEFSEAIAKEVPDIKVLDEELEILSRGLRLSEGERLDVLRMLERVHYIVLLMRELQGYLNNLIQFGGSAVLNYIFISLILVLSKPRLSRLGRTHNFGVLRLLNFLLLYHVPGGGWGCLRLWVNVLEG
jgi:hypothetical protein